MEDVTVDVHGHSPVLKTNMGGRKTCQGAVCGFSDANTALEDAGERSRSMKKLCIAVVLCVVFMSVEVGGGIKANSLAILTDAAHLLSDVAAFAISLFSLWASGWEATPRQSYGFFRVEILGALVSIQLIWLLTGILVYEAVARMIRHDPREVKGFLMFVVSAFGLVVNILMALLLGHDHDHDHGHHHVGENDIIVSQNSHNHHHHHHHHHNGVGSEPLLEEKKKRKNINVEGAYLHVIGDTVQSIGVMVGGGLIWWRPEWKMVDLVCTLVFSVVVMVTTIRMVRNVVEVLMESTPREVDATRLERGLCQMDEVVAVHELHVWAITVGKVLMACHVTIRPDADADLVLDKVVEYIRREYNISHVTIQIERHQGLLA